MANYVPHRHSLTTRVSWDKEYRTDGCPIDSDNPIWSNLRDYVEQKWRDIAPTWPLFTIHIRIHFPGGITVKAVSDERHTLLAELDFPPPNVDPLSPVWE